MAAKAYASYNGTDNSLEIIRAGENVRRRIRCRNLNPSVDKVHGIDIHGDEIWVFVGPHSNPRPNRKYVYYFSTLSGGGSYPL